jgi:hypothetical protein
MEGSIKGRRNRKKKERQRRVKRQDCTDLACHEPDLLGHRRHCMPSLAKHLPKHTDVTHQIQQTVLGKSCSYRATENRLGWRCAVGKQQLTIAMMRPIRLSNSSSHAHLRTSRGPTPREHPPMCTPIDTWGNWALQAPVHLQPNKQMQTHVRMHSKYTAWSCTNRAGKP